jgi:hypothetical protein
MTSDSLIEAIPRPEGIPREQFGPATGELFDRIMQITDNVGATDENRALRTKTEAGEPLLAPSYEFTACFRKWRSIVFTAGGSRSG